MLNYTEFFDKSPVVILNIPGTIILENKKINSIIFEVDYNSFSEDILKKIKLNREEEFNAVTKCITYDENKIKHNYLLVKYFENNQAKWYQAISENNTINFCMIRNKIEILKDNNILL